MKTQEELNALKTEVEAMNNKLVELTEEELAQVSGGDGFSYYLCPDKYIVAYEACKRPEKGTLPVCEICKKTKNPQPQTGFY